MKKFKLLSLFLTICFSACGQKSFDEMLSGMYHNTVPLIQSQELKDILEKDQQVIILDTRDKKEFKISHLPNAIRVGYDDFQKKSISKLSKDDKVIVYCSVGYRSERIGEKLQKMGFTDVNNLYGGIFEWKHEDLPVLNHKSAETDSVHTYNKSWSKWLQKGVKVYE